MGGTYDATDMALSIFVMLIIATVVGAVLCRFYGGAIFRQEKVFPPIT